MLSIKTGAAGLHCRIIQRFSSLNALREYTDVYILKLYQTLVPDTNNA